MLHLGSKNHNQYQNLSASSSGSDLETIDKHRHNDAGAFYEGCNDFKTSCKSLNTLSFTHLFYQIHIDAVFHIIRSILFLIMKNDETAVEFDLPVFIIH